MSAKRDPEDMLQRVLALIDEDISRIRTAAARKEREEPEGLGGLDPDTAWTLCRYGELLNRAVRVEGQVEERKQKKLTNLTTEELKQKAAELLGTKPQ